LIDDSPGLILPGQLASVTTRVPPSYTVVLPSRYGPLSHGIFCFEVSATPVAPAERGPPLSLWNTTSMFSRMCRFSSASITRPI
jgi:hypothetical protein